jgi:magnesium-transporting ATPase (P-type)
MFDLFDEDSEGPTSACIESFVIVLILVLNGVISIVQEINAQASVESMKAFQLNLMHVIRDCLMEEIKAKQLVRSDIVEAGEGSR